MITSALTLAPKFLFFFLLKKYKLLLANNNDIESKLCLCPHRGVDLDSFYVTRGDLFPSVRRRLTVVPVTLKPESSRLRCRIV